MSVKSAVFVRSDEAISWSVSPRHGHISSPMSRAAFAERAGLIEGNIHNGIESGKFFPETQGGIPDKDAPTDSANIAPPVDGKIASGERPGAAYLDRIDIEWDKHKVYPGEALDFIWYFSAQHKYRRFNYFITRADWDPGKPLSRAQFESKPFATYLNTHHPHWEYPIEVMWPGQPTTHTLKLPMRKGYHVLLGVWEIAETDKAFYQVVDLDFLSNGGEGQRPPSPTNVKVTNVEFNSVSLVWEQPSANFYIERYIISRNGKEIVGIDASHRNYTDNNVKPLTQYVYSVESIDELGNRSMPSSSVTVITPADSEDAPPTPPQDLHSMGETEKTVSLMWNASISIVPLDAYIIYRDGRDIHRVPYTMLEWVDQDVMPDTSYRYYVTAINNKQQESVPSNVICVHTDSNGGSEYPDWKLNTLYEVGDIVRDGGKLWRCLAKHTSYDPSWAPSGSDGFTLWTEIK